MNILKKLTRLLLMAVLTLAVFTVVALANPSPSPIPGAGAPPTSLNGWLMLLAPLSVAIMDFIFAINSSAKSNGILHWLYLLAGGKETPPSST